MWNSIITLFHNYIGSGLIIGWFALSVLYLFFRESDKSKRILFIYVPVILFLLFFNPWFAQIIYTYVGDEIYYRILWLAPVTIVIAYAMSSLNISLIGRQKFIFTIVGSLLIMISGSFIYSNIYFYKAENTYHMPQEVVDICDAIEVEGREVMAVFPPEFVQFVRQYSPVVCMPYGRDSVVESWGIENELYDVMSQEEIEVSKLASLAKESMCHYVILSQSKQLIGSMEEYEYELFFTIDGYDIYRDTTLYSGL